MGKDAYDVSVRVRLADLESRLAKREQLIYDLETNSVLSSTTLAEVILKSQYAHLRSLHLLRYVLLCEKQNGIALTTTPGIVSYLV